jgi:hypothetical protein
MGVATIYKAPDGKSCCFKKSAEANSMGQLSAEDESITREYVGFALS